MRSRPVIGSGRPWSSPVAGASSPRSDSSRRFRRCWMQVGPDRGVMTAPLAYIEAINGGLRAIDHEHDRTARGCCRASRWEGPTPDGLEDISLGVAVARASFVGTDLSRSMSAARLLIGRQPELPYVDGVGRAALGMALVMAGDPRAAIEILESACRLPRSPVGGSVLPSCPGACHDPRRRRSAAVSEWHARRLPGRTPGDSRVPAEVAWSLLPWVLRSRARDASKRPNRGWNMP